MRVASCLVACAMSLAGCGRVEPLVEGIGDAENALFTADGRLFVTGGENAYEVSANQQPRPMYRGKCNFTGIVTRRDHLYAACVSGEVGQSPAYLVAAKLTPAPELTIIHQFEKAVTPNGMAFANDGRLFVADSTALQSQIVVLTLDEADPRKVTSESTWQTGFLFLNGLRYWDGKLYGTDVNLIDVIPIQPDGTAGRVSALATGLGVFDDLWPTPQGILVADFLGGRVLAYSYRGRLLAQTPAVFDSPSSVMLGRPPLADERTLVVTEKGAIGDLTSDQGNRVSLFIRED